MPLVDARKTSLTGAQNSQKKSARRYAARGVISPPPPLGKKLDPLTAHCSLKFTLSKLIINYLETEKLKYSLTRTSEKQRFACVKKEKMP